MSLYSFKPLALVETRCSFQQEFDWAMSCMLAKLLQSCPTLCDPMDSSPSGSLCPRDSPGMGCHALLQGIFLTQGSNWSLLCLLHWQMGSLPLSLWGSPWICVYQTLKHLCQWLLCEIQTETRALHSSCRHIMILWQCIPWYCEPSRRDTMEVSWKRSLWLSLKDKLRHMKSLSEQKLIHTGLWQSRSG